MLISPIGVHKWGVEIFEYTSSQMWASARLNTAAVKSLDARNLQKMKRVKSSQNPHTHPVRLVPSAAGAIVQDGKILLVRHGIFKKWQIPGGMQEPGEAIQDTVHRELREELGLDLQVRDLIAVYSSPCWDLSYPAGDKIQQVLFFFGMQGPLGPIRLQTEELVECEFFPLNAIPADTFECCQQKIRDLIHFDGHVFLR